MATEVKLVSSSAPSLTALVDSAPGALNTLNELAAALGDDANFSTTVTNSIAAKVAKSGTNQVITDSANLYLDVGNVGVGMDATGLPFGTTTNRTVLSVNGTNSATLNIGTSGTQRGYLFSDGTYTQVASSGAIPLRLGSNDTPHIYILNNGNVGVGEATPQGKLHVKSADSGATADSGADELVVEGSGNTGISILSGASASGSIYFGDSGLAYDGYIQYDQTNRKFNIITAGGGGGFHIDSVGNAKLSGGNNNEVYMDIFSDSGSNRGAGYFRFLTDGASDEQSVAQIYMEQGSGDGAARKCNMYFQVSDNGNPATAMTIANNKNVGIGTTSPASLLHVDGSINGPAVTIHQTGGASSNYSGLSVETSSTGTNIAEFLNSGTRYARFAGNGRLVLENKNGTAGSPNLEIVNPSASQFNHSIEVSCGNMTNGQNNGVFIGKSMSSKNTGYVGYRWYSNNSNDNYIHLSHWAADYLFYVKGSGDYYHAGSAISDRDLKENINEVPGTSLDKIINLPIKSFKMKKVDDYTTEVRHQKTGFIAQEVQEVLPDVVTGTDGQKDMGIDPTGIIAHLVRAVTELEARVKELEG